MKSYAKRTFDHYAAHGVNASFVVGDSYEPGYKERKITTFAARKGREDEGEAVQIELTIETRYEKTSRQQCASLSFDAATWNALVEFVKENHEVPRVPFSERVKAIKAEGGTG
jgi:hypothetical protein